MVILVLVISRKDFWLLLISEAGTVPFPAWDVRLDWSERERDGDGDDRGAERYRCRTVVDDGDTTHRETRPKTRKPVVVADRRGGFLSRHHSALAL